MFLQVGLDQRQQESGKVAAFLELPSLRPLPVSGSPCSNFFMVGAGSGPAGAPGREAFLRRDPVLEEYALYTV